MKNSRTRIEERKNKTKKPNTKMAKKERKEIFEH